MQTPDWQDSKEMLPEIKWRDGLTFKAVEKKLLYMALLAHKYDIRATSKALGVCRATVYKKTKEHFGDSVAEMRRRFNASAA